MIEDKLRKLRALLHRVDRLRDEIYRELREEEDREYGHCAHVPVVTELDPKVGAPQG